MTYELHEMLRQVRNRLRTVRRGWALALCWLLWTIVTWAAWRWGGGLGYSGQQLVVVIAAAALATAVLCQILVHRSTADPHRIARRIEARHPELDAVLLAALD